MHWLMRFQLLLIVALFPYVTHADAIKHYQNAKLGIAFDYPAAWEILECPTNDNCSLKVSDIAIDKHDYIIYMTVSAKTLEEAAKDSFSLFQQDGKWWKSGRFGEDPAQELVLPAGKAIVGVSNCGIGDPETGFHAAGGECLAAVASDGRHAIVIDSNGQSTEVNKQIKVMLHSFRFLPENK